MDFQTILGPFYAKYSFCLNLGKNVQKKNTFSGKKFWKFAKNGRFGPNFAWFLLNQLKSVKIF